MQTWVPNDSNAVTPTYRHQLSSNIPSGEIDYDFGGSSVRL